MMWCYPKLTRRRYLSLLAGFALAIFASAGQAETQIAVPTVSGSPQLFVQRGQSVDVTLDGQRLNSVGSIAISHAHGLNITLLEPEKSPADHLRLHLVADDEASFGDREFRLVSPTGVSAPMRVGVGQFPEVVEKEPNNNAEQAQDVTFPVTLAGKIDTSGDIDCFRFTAIKGQQLVFDVHAVRSRSPLDPLLAIHDEAGHELAFKVDLEEGDPIAIFEVPADGRFILSIRDLQYRGGADYAYRINAGLIPYVQSVLPMSAQPGKISELKPFGVNLGGAGTIPLDLTYAAEGQISVRARASAGLSNPMKVDVSDMPTVVDEKPAHSASSAIVVLPPVDISGRIQQAGDENFFKFHVSQKQAYSFEAIGHSMGSPLAAVLVLRDANGDAMQTVDDAAGGNARVSRELDAGDYFVSIRDLYFNGGLRYAYRLQIKPGSVTIPSTQDFSVRFLPDALRISRGGNAALFVDLQRKGEFKGDITVDLLDLPPGVTCSPLTVNDKLPGASGMLVLSAVPDAASGSFPIRLRASATIGNSVVSHEGVAMLNARPVDQAYLTVIDRAPFTIEPAAVLNPPRLQQLSAEADALATKLATSNPQPDVLEAKWEKKAGVPISWTPLQDPTIGSASGTQFTILPDASYLASLNPNPEIDTYTVSVTTDMANITAVRLEAMPDPSLPNHGPGRNPAGNFVLSHFTCTVAPKSDPAQAKPVVFHHPRADFEQDGYTIADAIEPKAARGWAMYPRGGTSNEAILFTTGPIGTDKGSLLIFSLDQKFTQQHTLGHFRLSLTTDPDAEFKASIPKDIVATIATQPGQRSPEQRSQLSGYYRTIDPQVASDTEKLEAIRRMIAMPSEMVRLAAAISADIPELNAQREQWEKAVLAGSAWLPLDISTAQSQAGAVLTKQPDDSIFVSGVNPPTDTYTVTGSTPVQNITAVKLEALPDSRLGANGPGRVAPGNFVLTKFTVYASAKDLPDMTPPVEFKSARATFEQPNFTAEKSLLGVKDAGWAVLPHVGQPSTATFYATHPFGGMGDTVLTVVLDHQSGFAQHTLGRFRIWVTSQIDPDSATMLPIEILAAFKTPLDKRNDRQKRSLIEYYRSIAPGLEPVRRRLAELKGEMDSATTLTRGEKFTVPFLLNRAAFEGEVRVTIEGFVASRDVNTAAPNPINAALKFEPLTLAAGKPGGNLNVEVDGNSGTGPRYCVLRVEAKSGDDTRVEVSPPFILTVLEK